MSILIKGMEMPTTCRDCRLSTFTDFDSMPFCNITMDDICLNDWETKRCDNCPLVPVPPHGRLGDLDNFALLVLNWISTQEKAYPHEDSNALAWRLGAKAMANQIYRDVKAYPTIIPAEEGE